MNVRSLRGLASNRDYVCLSCRLQFRLSQARQNLRYQHTSTESTGLSPNLPDGAGSALPPLPRHTRTTVLKNSEESQSAVPELPVRKAQSLEASLHTKFLEKRREASQWVPTVKDAKQEEDDALFTKPAKLSKAEKAAKRAEKKSKATTPEKEALPLSAKAKKTAKDAKPVGKGKRIRDEKLVKGEKLATEEKPAKEEKPAMEEKPAREEKPVREEKPSLSRSRKDRKTRRRARKAMTIIKNKRLKLKRNSKAEVPELREASNTADIEQHRLKLAQVFSGISQEPIPSTVTDIPRRTVLSGPSFRKIEGTRPASTPKLKKVVVKDRDNGSELRRKKASSSAKLSNVAGHQTLEGALRPEGKDENVRGAKAEIEKIDAEDLILTPLEVDRLPVPSLAYGLERVLFNPGVYHLQDPRSRVFNFDPYLQKIMPVAEFDFDALKEYITSSKDQSLKQLAQAYGKRYVGSTSSMTGALAHFHFLLSQWREINTSMLSKKFPDKLLSFTELQRCPSAIFLRWQDGSYAIDADKQFDSANILMMLGKSMEKLLTMDTRDFERYRKSNPEQITEEERNAPESFHYTTMGDLLMRSQLDAFDARLPGTGMFDLKTRAVVSIRMEPTNYEKGVGYQIKTGQGDWESFEREYYDMIRAAFLKYSLQVRMGRMDGIFVAYHNTERIFGFQYVSIEELDSTLHGQWDTSLGNQEFKLSLGLLNTVLDKATKKYPEKSLRIHFETREVQTPFMYIFAEPVTEEQIQGIQSQNHEKVEAFQRKLLGLEEGDPESDREKTEEEKWADIQAGVQEAMARDELSATNPSQDEDESHTDAKDTHAGVERSKVFEDGPLYRNRSLGSVDEDEAAAAAGSIEEEEEEEVEEDDDDEEDEEEEDEANEDTEENEEQEGVDDQDEELAELEDEEHSQTNAEYFTGERTEGENDGTEMGKVTSNGNHITESIVDGEKAIELGMRLDSEADQDDPRNLESLAEVDRANQAEVDRANQAEEIWNEREIHEEELESLAHDISADGEQSEVDAALESDRAQRKSGSSNGDSIQSDMEEQPAPDNAEFDTTADQPFLEELDKEHNPATGSEVLAMTLTIRNKVNGEYVERPENLSPKDKWSIEYSLEAVPKPTRAWSLYLACQERRRKKLDGFEERQEKNTVNHYMLNLRRLSKTGKIWRDEMDKKDQEKKVAVMGQPIPPKEVGDNHTEQ